MVECIVAALMPDVAIIELNRWNHDVSWDIRIRFICDRIQLSSADGYYGEFDNVNLAVNEMIKLFSDESS